MEFADLQQPNIASLAYVSVTCKRIFSLSEKEHFLQQITGQSRNIKQKQTHQLATRGCPEV